MRPSLENRFWAKVNKTESCWIWTAYKSPDGYGRFACYGTVKMAHRVSYELNIGKIPLGLTIDHLCRLRSCVNPGHMEVVTNRENILRGNTIAARYASRDACHRGHKFPLSESGKRVCQECNKQNSHEWYLKNRTRLGFLTEYRPLGRYGT